MRRKRNNGRWLPPDPYNTIVTDADLPVTNVTQCIIKEVHLPTATVIGGSRTVSVPLVGDANEDIIPGAVNASGEISHTLVDVAFGYSLKRVVGKMFCSIAQQNIDPDDVRQVMVTVGLMVRRVNEAGAPTALNTFTDTYDATCDPWIWRRNWLLTNQVAMLANRPTSYLVGSGTNYAHGPALGDGPHVDAKTRRTVKAEERLFLDFTVTTLDSGENGQIDGAAVYLYFDLRFFGRVFQSATNRRNASR